MGKGSGRRTVLVSGGAGALGRWVVQRFSDDGHALHVPVRDPEAGEVLRDFLGVRADGVDVHAGMDLTDAAAVDRLFADVQSSDGRGPDVLLNLAGGFAMGSVEETGPETWQRMIGINATTAFLCSRAAFPHMKRAGWGRIVNVAALPAEGGQPGLSAYAAAKAAVLNLTRTLSREGVAHGITANAVLPSIIDTPANREAMPGADTSAWLPPGEVAEVCRFLTSDAARTLTGAALTLRLD